MTISFLIAFFVLDIVTPLERIILFIDYNLIVSIDYLSKS